MVSGGSNGSDRTKGTPHLGAFGVLTAIVLSCLIVGFFAFLEGYQSERNENSSYEYSQAAKRNARIACQDREPAGVADCIYDEIASAREKSDTHQDLTAQQWMARWAGILVIVTVATTIISWFALKYLRDTFIQTRKAVRETAKATRAMRKANKIARENSNSQLRPWLLLEEIKLQPGTSGSDWEVVVIFKNYGISPAVNVCINTNWFCQIIPEPFEFVELPDEMPVSNRGVTGPGGTVMSGFFPLSDDQAFNQWMFFNCRAEYKSAFDDEVRRCDVKVRSQGVRVGGQFTARWTIIDKQIAT